MPGRCEPGTGEINYPAIAQALREVGYTGVVGLGPGRPRTATPRWSGSGRRSRSRPGSRSVQQERYALSGRGQHGVLERALSEVRTVTTPIAAPTSTAG